MIQFSYMDKSEKDIWLPQLFDLLYLNMQNIAPSGMSYEEEREEWLSNVSPAIDKAPRQIIMCFDGAELAGYIQYYTRDDMLMVEEIQLAPNYHRTMLFYRFCSFLAANLPDDIEYIEAFAEARNTHSQRIMQKLGMQIDAEEGGAYVHLRGKADIARKLFHSGR